MPKMPDFPDGEEVGIRVSSVVEYNPVKDKWETDVLTEAESFIVVRGKSQYDVIKKVMQMIKSAKKKNETF